MQFAVRAKMGCAAPCDPQLFAFSGGASFAAGLCWPAFAGLQQAQVCPNFKEAWHVNKAITKQHAENRSKAQFSSKT